MKLPIIINENGDVSFYESLEKAEIDIEPIDVNNKKYIIYDSEGLLLIPVVVEDPVYDVVKIYASKESKKQDLINTLINFFSLLGHDPVILKTMSLEELVKLGFKN